jgi:TPR repeat protein
MNRFGCRPALGGRMPGVFARALPALLVLAMAGVVPPAHGASAGDDDFVAAQRLLDEYRDLDARGPMLAAARAGHAGAAAALGMLALHTPSWAGAEAPLAFARHWLARAAAAEPPDPAAVQLLGRLDGVPPQAGRRPIAAR